VMTAGVELVPQSVRKPWATAPLGQSVGLVAATSLMKTMTVLWPNGGVGKIAPNPMLVYNSRLKASGTNWSHCARWPKTLLAAIGAVKGPPEARKLGSGALFKYFAKLIESAGSRTHFATLTNCKKA